MVADIRFPMIDLPATGENILRLRESRGFTVRDLQQFFGFDAPQAIYKWQRGESLPTVDNLFALSRLFDTSVDNILVEMEERDDDLSFPMFGDIKIYTPGLC